MRKIVFTFALLMAACTMAMAQAEITFKESTHDFGTVKQENGDVKTRFTFTNTGDEPLVIDGVRASCGCTTPSWTKEPVMPGKTGFIDAKYVSSTRPGPFNKSLMVTSNTSPAMTTLTIKGNVTPKGN